MTLAIIIVIILILLFILAGPPFWPRFSEKFVCGDSSVGNNSYVKLYEGFQSQKLAFEFPNPLNTSSRDGNYLKQIIPINLKSVDINLPCIGDPYDRVRRVEIWSVEQGKNYASEEAGFYNSYLQPESELRANPAKFSMILRVLPGEHVKTDMNVPIKKIFLIIVM
jgi:hypothetical protein